MIGLTVGVANFEFDVDLDWFYFDKEFSKEAAMETPRFTNSR